MAEIKAKTKAYIFQVASGNPAETFMGRPKGKDPIRYKFDMNGLFKGTEEDKENLQHYIDRGGLKVFEGGLLEKHIPLDQQTPAAQLMVLVAQAKDAGLKEFNNKPIAKCTAEELSVAMKSIEA
jgi:hypothetical protein